MLKIETKDNGFAVSEHGKASDLANEYINLGVLAFRKMYEIIVDSAGKELADELLKTAFTLTYNDTHGTNYTVAGVELRNDGDSDEVD